MKVKQGRISLELEKENERIFLSSKKEFFSEYPLRSKNDPRPLYDRIYLSSCIRELIFFLTKNNFEMTITPKVLFAPTSKDFFQILIFLLKKIDQNLFFEKKIEENFPQIFRKIKYPFPISKSSCYAIGSPHIWPSLLGCLKWLIELLQYDNCLKKEKKSSSFSKNFSGKSIWNQMKEDYHNFLMRSGDSEKISKIIKALTKYKIKQEKKLKFNSVQKLRKRKKNFHSFNSVFLLLKVLNKKDFQKKKIIKLFFPFRNSEFKIYRRFKFKNKFSSSSSEYFSEKIYFNKKKERKKKDINNGKLLRNIFFLNLQNFFNKRKKSKNYIDYLILNNKRIFYQIKDHLFKKFLDFINRFIYIEFFFRKDRIWEIFYFFDFSLFLKTELTKWVSIKKFPFSYFLKNLDYKKKTRQSKIQYYFDYIEKKIFFSRKEFNKDMNYFIKKFKKTNFIESKKPFCLKIVFIDNFGYVHDCKLANFSLMFLTTKISFLKVIAKKFWIFWLFRILLKKKSLFFIKILKISKIK